MISGRFRKPLQDKIKIMEQCIFHYIHTIKHYTGVTRANANNGIVDNPKSHRQPRVGITANAKTTSKQAPNAQKH